MPLKDGDPTVEFENVQVIDRRPPEKQERSMLCRFADGTERFVPRSQVPADFEFPDEGVPFDLEVSQWIVDQWAEEDEAPPDVVVLADVVCLKESAKALKIRLPSGSEEWCPTKGIHKDSPVQGDGDRGELHVAPWLAKMKGWRGSGAAARDEEEKPNVGTDARSGGIDDNDDVPF